MTTPFLITGYQHSLLFCQAVEREWGGGNFALQNTQFCPLHPRFRRLASRGQYQDVQALIFQIKQTCCKHRSQSNLSSPVTQATTT